VSGEPGGRTGDGWNVGERGGEAKEETLGEAESKDKKSAGLERAK
jgi:hypothetical protein